MTICLGNTLLPLALSLSPAQAEQSATRNDLSPSERSRVDTVTAPTTDFSQPELYERNSAGAGTSKITSGRDAFSQPQPNLTSQEAFDFRLGEPLFDKLWASSPSSTQASDGLGPLYNARSCASCHLNGGRGHPPQAGERPVTLFLRLSIPPQTDAQRKYLADKTRLLIPEPTYGGQLQTFAVPGLAGEAKLEVSYTDKPVHLADGTVIALQQPRYQISDLAFGPMHQDVMISPRVTPPMPGLGLIDAIHPDDILSNADPDDADGDGISGKPQWVRHIETGELVLGRFGWKAANPTVRAQAADAFFNDIGISTPLHTDPWGDCTQAQPACRERPHGEQKRLGATEAPDPVLDLVAFYSASLAVPARRKVGDPQVLRGKQVFYETGCASCHHPKYVTRKDAAEPSHRFQLIWPYTDLLLHDMGEGLADQRPVGEASGREWRTPPLWGIGLTKAVNGHTRFLHDGRARTLLEAILWHGGEAEPARNRVRDMEKADRTALITFLESL